MEGQQRIDIPQQTIVTGSAAPVYSQTTTTTATGAVPVPLGAERAVPAGVSGGLPPVGGAGQPKGWVTPRSTQVTRKLQWMRMLLLLWELLTLALTIISFALISSIDPSGYSWRNIKAFQYLMSAGVIVAFFALLFFLLHLLEIVAKRPAGHWLKWMLLIVAELILATLLFGGACAVTGYLDGAKGNGLCTEYNQFCSKGRAGSAFAFVAWLTLFLSIITKTLIMSSAGFTRHI